MHLISVTREALPAWPDAVSHRVPECNACDFYTGVEFSERRSWPTCKTWKFKSSAQVGRSYKQFIETPLSGY